MFIDSQIELVGFWLTIFMVGEFMLGHSTLALFDKVYHSWHEEYDKLIWLPGHRTVMFLWVMVTTAVATSIYTFIKHLYPVFPVDAYVVPTVAVLFIINMWLHRLWLRALIVQRHTGFAIGAGLLLVGTGVGILVVFGLQRKFVEMGCFLVYVVWCCAALWLSWQVSRIDQYLAYVALHQQPETYEMSSMGGGSAGFQQH